MPRPEYSGFLNYRINKFMLCLDNYNWPVTHKDLLHQCILKASITASVRVLRRCLYAHSQGYSGPYCGGSRVWKGGFHAHVHSSNHAPFDAHATKVAVLTD